MARVTVEDCILKVPNRFELVLLSSQRAREISSGAQMMVEKDNDKNPVISLREIADTDISLDELRDSLIRNHQKVLEVEEDEEDIIDMMDGEQDTAAVEAEQAHDTEQAIARGDLHEEVHTPEESPAEDPAGNPVADEEEKI